MISTARQAELTMPNIQLVENELLRRGIVPTCERSVVSTDLERVVCLLGAGGEVRSLYGSRLRRRSLRCVVIDAFGGQHSTPGKHFRAQGQTLLIMLASSVAK